MVDTLALVMLVITLLLAPKDAKEISFEALEPSQARVSTLVATRTEQGFTVTAKGEKSTVTIQKHAEKDGVWLVKTGEGEEPISLDLGATLRALEGATGDDRSATHGEATITVSRRGDVEYVLASGSGTCFVRRAGQPMAAGKTLTGVLKVRKNTGVMSEENYRLGEIVLTLDDLHVVTLVPTAAVAKDALVKLDGKRVEVTVVEQPAAKPNPHEAAPVGPDRKPLGRAPRYEVKAIKALD